MPGWRRERGVLLEVSGRKGHCLANGHVVQVARRTGAKVIFGSDSHAPEDLRSRPEAEKVLAGAGLSADEVAAAFAAAERVGGPRGCDRSEERLQPHVGRATWEGLA